MHSALTRLQNVFGFFTTVATFVALAIAFTSLVTTPSPQLKEGALALKNVQVYVVLRCNPNSLTYHASKDG